MATKTPVKKLKFIGAEKPKAYCTKCKKKQRSISSMRLDQTKNGRFMAKGTHKPCGTNLSVFVSNNDVKSVRVKASR